MIVMFALPFWLTEAMPTFVIDVSVFKFVTICFTVSGLRRTLIFLINSCLTADFVSVAAYDILRLRGFVVFSGPFGVGLREVDRDRCGRGNTGKLSNVTEGVVVLIQLLLLFDPVRLPWQFVYSPVFKIGLWKILESWFVVHLFP